jgi:phage baseplate assembly protein W
MPNDNTNNIGVREFDQSYIDAINRAYSNGHLNVSDVYEIYRQNSLDEANKKIQDMVKAGKEAVMKNNTPTEIRDVTLNVSEFKKLKSTNGKEAVARMIQNILVTKPGTYPNNPDFGVGIENYLFDLATQSLKSELNANITNQMTKWLNKDLINTNISTKQEIEFLRSSDNKYITVAIFFTVYDENPKGNSEEYKLSLFYTGDSSNNKIISKLDL